MDTIPAEVAQQLSTAAESYARAVLWAFGLKKRDPRFDEVRSSLLFAGDQVYRATGNVAFALKRMEDRQVNERQRLHTELTRPETPMATEDLDLRNEHRGHRPEVAAMLEELLERLPDEQRGVFTDIAEGRAMKHIADELGIHVDTLERRLTTWQERNQRAWNR